MRKSGILLPIFALPSEYGIGCFSKEAYEFVDQMKRAGQTRWQILPMGPTGYGDSPYQAFSTFAGNPYFIDLETLVQDGLLSVRECREYSYGDCEDRVDYEKQYFSRFKVLKIAYERFQPNQDYWDFTNRNAEWLDEYCLYMAIKDRQQGKGWLEWPDELRGRRPEALESARNELAWEMNFYRFQQYEFAKQWRNLHEYANRQGIEIIGDIPIYVALDSADAWAAPQLFQMDENNIPTDVAGCPPDAFSAEGQLWGNPLYNWEYHRATGYEWWIKRLAHCFEWYDIVRIDHFRGFESFYAIPYGAQNAVNGRWMPGPGMELFHALEDRLGKKNIIAEDLGFLTDEVRKLLSDSGFPGMKVIQFAFDSRESANYLPHTYTPNCVVYTGTHDNTTTRDWYHTASRECREFAKEYMHKSALDEDSLAWDFIALAMSSVAELCVIPIQDYLNIDGSGRINHPSTSGGNWRWRLKRWQITDEVLDQMYRMTKLYGRL